MDAFKRILDQQLPGASLEVHLEKWSIKDKMEVIMTFLKQKGSIFFYEIFSNDRTISEFVVTFLALLELAHLGLIKVFQPTYESDIQLIPSFDENGENGDGNDNGQTDKTDH